MNDSLSRLRQLWLETTRTNQIMIASALVAALVVGVGFVFWASSPDYATLVSNASPENANKIIGHLKEKKIPYRLANGSIDVPAGQKDELLMELAGTGALETGSMGWGLLEKAPFGQTQAMEQETIRHAHEVMMETTVEKLDPVASASVHFTDGDKNELFDPDKKEGTANVTVRVKPGHEMTKENVRSVVALVQSGYANIPTKNVYVVDGQGHLLWNGAEQSEGVGGTDEREAQESRKSEELTRKIQAHIDRIAGPGKSTVLVRATLNLDKRVEKKREVLPGVATTKSTVEETLSGGSMNGMQPAVGQPGVAANANGGAGIQTYAAGNVSANGAGKYNSTNSTVVTEPGVTETSTVLAPGELKTASVIVTLDKTIPAATVATLKDQIPILMGDDPASPNPNIRVSVETADFDRKALEEDRKAAETAASAERINRYVGNGVPIALMLLMLFLLSRSLRRPHSAAMLALAGGNGMRPALAGATAGGGLNLVVGEDLPAGINVEEALKEPKIIAVGGDSGVHTYEVIAEQFDANLESIVHLAKSKPEVVAQLVKSWIAEEKR